MSWKERADGRGRGYHHGNLREALIQAALDLIAEKGPTGFTFAEAARSAGVSPAAPYRHFRDRDELLSDVAMRGFEHVRGRAGEGAGTRAARTRRRRSSAWAAPISPSRGRSRPTIRRCSNPGLPLGATSGASRGGGARLLGAAHGVGGACRDASREGAAAGLDGELPRLGARRMASHRSSRAAMRGGASCRCRRRSCLRRASSIYLRGLGMPGI